jgi:stage II sporulation protein D
LLSCTPTKRVLEKGEVNDKTETETDKDVKGEVTLADLNLSEIRVSMQGLIHPESLIIGSPAYLFNNEIKVALIKSGNAINCFNDNGRLSLKIKEEVFNGEKFSLTPSETNEIIKVNGKKYRGKIQISSSGNSIDIINVLNLEDYVKGVLAKEMPLGKNEENLEALKALAVCVRTYAIQKMKDGKVYFDIYADTRDQVYGGVDAESSVSNRAVEQTEKLILKYNNNPAIIFYHSTCGGYTESSANVFTKDEIPYLTGIKDGDEPNCKISPRFHWEETYSKELIINRLKNYSLIENQNYLLENIYVISRFSSGRVNELEIIVSNNSGERKSVIIRGNEIRSILKNADGKSILWSTMFDVSLKSNSVILKGNGFGHGVGLCQWGAIALSQTGSTYQEILNHFYPGTEIERIDD